MKTMNQRRRGQRRDFLKGVAVAGGGVALAATTGATLADIRDTAPGAEAAVPESRGYQETQHIRQYYDKARF